MSSRYLLLERGFMREKAAETGRGLMLRAQNAQGKVASAGFLEIPSNVAPTYRDLTFVGSGWAPSLPSAVSRHRGGSFVGAMLESDSQSCMPSR